MDGKGWLGAANHSALAAGTCFADKCQLGKRTGQVVLPGTAAARGRVGLDEAFNIAPQGGLSRWFLANGRAVPANVFDNFISGESGSRPVVEHPVPSERCFGCGGELPMGNPQGTRYFLIGIPAVVIE